MRPSSPLETGQSGDRLRTQTSLRTTLLVFIPVPVSGIGIGTVPRLIPVTGTGMTHLAWHGGLLTDCDTFSRLPCLLRPNRSPRTLRPQSKWGKKRHERSTGGRLRRRWRWVRRLRHGGPPVGGSEHHGRAAGSRWQRQPFLDPRPAGLRQDLRRPQGELDVRNGAGRQRASHILAARQGARWLVVHQRHDLHPWPTRGFRPLAAARQSRLVRGRRAPVFQTLRKPGTRQRRLSWLRRTARGVGRALHAPNLRRVYRGGRGAWVPPQRRFQRPRAGGCGLPADHHQKRQALVNGGRISETGDEPPQPAHDHPRADGTGAVRRQARRRHRIRAGRR